MIIAVLFETNFSDAILEVVRAADDFNFHAHEKDRQVAPVNFGKTHGILLRGDDDFRLPLFATIDGVQDFLLAASVMVGEALGINQCRSQRNEALFKTVRLRNAAERSDLFSVKKIQRFAFPSKKVLKI